MRSEQDRSEKRGAQLPEARPEMDEVNDASFDSFPASDAPGWSPMHVGPPRVRVSVSASKSAAAAADRISA